MIDMGHEEAAAELAAVAIDSARTDVSEAVRAHAAVCPECGPELSAMEETLAMLGHLVPSSDMNRGRGAGIRSRLVMRARSERESRSAPVPGPPDISRGVASLKGLGHRATPPAQRAITGENKRVTGETKRVTAESRRFTPPHAVVTQTESIAKQLNWLAAAAIFLFVATAAQLVRVTVDRNEMRNHLAVVDTLAPVADSLESMVVQKDAMIAAMAGRDMKVVPLMNKTSREPLGRMMWNRESNDWIMVAYSLPKPREGMTYQVWLVTDDAQISAGTFRPGEDGKSMMHANYRLAPNALRSVAITEEPEGGVPSPTGPMVVSGSV